MLDRLAPLVLSRRALERALKRIEAEERGLE
jgi:hypothetical protein